MFVVTYGVKFLLPMRRRYHFYICNASEERLSADRFLLFISIFCVFVLFIVILTV